jgi:hypothetical protein
VLVGQTQLHKVKDLSFSVCKKNPLLGATIGSIGPYKGPIRWSILAVIQRMIRKPHPSREFP